MGDTRYSYRDIDQMATRLAVAMQKRGVRRHDRVALFLPNGVEMVVGIFAALRCGAAFMPINPQTKTAKLRYMLTDSTPRCLVAQAELAATWTEAARDLPEPSSILVAGAPRPAPETGSSRCRRRWRPPTATWPIPGSSTSTWPRSSTPRGPPATPRA